MVARIGEATELRVVVLAHAIAWPLDHDRVGVMQQAIEQGRGERAVVVEDFGPQLERAIGRDDRRTTLVALADHLEERVGAELVDGQIAEFVDDEQGRLGQPSELALDAADGLRGGERVTSQ